MPSYYFDVFDGRKVTTDEFGDVSTDIADAAGQAVNLLKDLSQDIIPSGDLRDFGVLVRDDQGQDLYRAALTFRDVYLNPDRPETSQDFSPGVSDIDPIEIIRQSREIRQDVRSSVRKFRSMVDESRQARSLLWSKLLRAA